MYGDKRRRGLSVSQRFRTSKVGEEFRMNVVRLEKDGILRESLKTAKG